MIYLGAQEPEDEQVQALSDYVVSFVLEILSLNDNRGMYKRPIIAPFLVVECVCGIIIIIIIIVG